MEILTKWSIFKESCPVEKGIYHDCDFSNCVSQAQLNDHMFLLSTHYKFLQNIPETLKGNVFFINKYYALFHEDLI